MPGCIVSATTASFRSVEKRRLRATPVITSTLENVSDIGTCLGLSLGPPASAGVRSKRGALQIVYVYLQENGQLRLIGSSSARLRFHLPIYRVPVQPEMNQERLPQHLAPD